MFWNNYQSFRQEALNRIPKHTPDVCLLDQKQTHLVFDYSRVIPKELRICSAFSREKLTMWQCTKLDYTPPVVIEARETWETAKVGGGLYLISSEDLLCLDKHKQNGVLFNRKHVEVVVPDSEMGKHPVKSPAWMYVGCNDYWGEQIEWDHSFYRGRGGAFAVAPMHQDQRRWVGNYFRYIPGRKATISNTKCFIHYHQGLTDPSPSVVPAPKVEPIVIHVKDHVSSS